jgi:hypothetical protein
MSLAVLTMAAGGRSSTAGAAIRVDGGMRTHQ